MQTKKSSKVKISITTHRIPDEKDLKEIMKGIVSDLKERKPEGTLLEGGVITEMINGKEQIVASYSIDRE